MQLALQLSPSDLTAVLNNTEALIILVVVTSGYVFLSLTARGTELWKGISSNEKFLIGLAIGGSFAAMAYFFLLSLIDVFGFPTSADTILAMATLVTFLLLIVSPLTIHASDVTDRKNEMRVSLVTLSRNAFWIAFGFFAFLIGFYTFSYYYYPEEVSYSLIPYLFQVIIVLGFTAVVSVGFFFSYQRLYYNAFLRRSVDGQRYIDLYDSGKYQSENAREKIRWRKPVSAAIIVLFVLTLIGIQMAYSSQQMQTWTPKIDKTVSQYSIPYNSKYNFSYALKLDANFFPSFNVSRTSICSMAIYQLENETIRMEAPAFLYYPMTEIRISNPNNFSNTMNINQNFQQLVYQAGPVWQDINYTISPKLRIDVGPSQQQTSYFYANLSNQSRFSNFRLNLYHFQVANSSVSSAITCKEIVSDVPLSNSTVISHTFYFTNDESFVASIKVLNLRELAYFSPFDLRANLYVNGTIGPYSFNSLQDIAGPWGYALTIPPHHSEKFTINWTTSVR